MSQEKGQDQAPVFLGTVDWASFPFRKQRGKSRGQNIRVREPCPWPLWMKSNRGWKISFHNEHWLSNANPLGTEGTWTSILFKRWMTGIGVFLKSRVSVHCVLGTNQWRKWENSSAERGGHCLMPFIIFQCSKFCTFTIWLEVSLPCWSNNNSWIRCSVPVGFARH